MTRLKLGVALIALIGLGFWIWGGSDTAERQVRASLDALVVAVIAGDEDAIKVGVATDYHDRWNHDIDAIAGRVVRETRGPSPLELVLDDVNIEVDEEQGVAVVTFRPRLGGAVPEQAEGRISPPRADGRRLRLEMRRHGDRWLVTQGGVSFSFSDHL